MFVSWGVSVAVFLELFWGGRGRRGESTSKNEADRVGGFHYFLAGEHAGTSVDVEVFRKDGSVLPFGDRSSYLCQALRSPQDVQLQGVVGVLFTAV